MILRSVFSFIILGLSVPSYAGDLNKYSTEELMEEVGRRIDDLSGGGGGGSTGKFELSFSCNNHEIVIKMVSQNADKAVSLHSNDNSSCIKQRDILKQRYSGAFSGFKTVSMCELHEMVTMRVTAEDIKEVAGRTYMGDITKCLAALPK